MNIYTTFEDNLYRAITTAFNKLGTSCEVIFSHSNGPEPRQSYCVLNTISINKTGRAQTGGGVMKWGGDALKEYSVQHYEAMVQINFYGNGAAENSMDFYSQLDANTVVRECYQKNNLAVRTMSGLRRSPQLRDTQWIDSYAVDLTVGWAVQTVQNVDWADYITVNGNTIPLQD